MGPTKLGAPRKTALARPGTTVIYRPVLSTEMALHNNKLTTV
jgi:hypothetical protein